MCRHARGRWARTATALALAVVVVASSCGGDDGATGSATTTPTTTPTTPTTPTTEPSAADPSATEPPATEPPATVPPATEPPEPITILVTNDDGIGAPGIDALVQALSEIPDVEVVVYAPATNQSGTSDTTSPTPPSATAASTASGHPGVAVAGTPADSVLYALDVDGVVPDLVVSGVNSGQNIGTFVPLSGTLGAARTAARREIPAIAVSAGNLEDSDHVTAAAFARDEVLSRLDDAAPELGADENDEQVVVSLNVPTCPAGTAVRGVLDVAPAVTFPAGTNGLDLVFDCGSSAPASTATDDATAMIIGFASRSIVPADL